MDYNLLAFQFYKVRLKEWLGLAAILRNILFQFYKVRLKVKRDNKYLCVSE